MLPAWIRQVNIGADAEDDSCSAAAFFGRHEQAARRYVDRAADRDRAADMAAEVRRLRRRWRMSRRDLAWELAGEPEYADVALEDLDGLVEHLEGRRGRRYIGPADAVQPATAAARKYWPSAHAWCAVQAVLAPIVGVRRVAFPPRPDVIEAINALWCAKVRLWSANGVGSLRRDFDLARATNCPRLLFGGGGPAAGTPCRQRLCPWCWGLRAALTLEVVLRAKRKYPDLRFRVGDSVVETTIAGEIMHRVPRLQYRDDPSRDRPYEVRIQTRRLTAGGKAGMHVPHSTMGMARAVAWLLAYPVEYLVPTEPGTEQIDGYDPLPMPSGIELLDRLPREVKILNQLKGWRLSGRTGVFRRVGIVERLTHVYDPPLAPRRGTVRSSEYDQARAALVADRLGEALSAVDGLRCPSWLEGDEECRVRDMANDLRNAAAHWTGQPHCRDQALEHLAVRAVLKAFGLSPGPLIDAAREAGEPHLSFATFGRVYEDCPMVFGSHLGDLDGLTIWSRKKGVTKHPLYRTYETLRWASILDQRPVAVVFRLGNGGLCVLYDSNAPEVVGDMIRFTRTVKRRRLHMEPLEQFAAALRWSP